MELRSICNGMTELVSTGMPELPEVETVRRGLQQYLQDATATKVAVNRPDLRFPLPLNLQEKLANNPVAAIDRRAKYLLIRLASHHTWLVHLGMTGQFRYTDTKDYQPQKHDHVVLTLNNNRTIAYHDPRRFGFMELFTPPQLAEYPGIKALGPEPLGEELTGKYLHTITRNRQTPVKSFLLDQRRIAGIGNIYAREALHGAGVRPTKPAAKLTKPQAERLVENIKDVLTRAIAAGGSTISDHQQLDGSTGYFQHHFTVYGKEGEPCPKCGTDHPVMKTVLAGRATYHCKKCQK